MLSYLRSLNESEAGVYLPPFNYVVVMVISKNLHMKISEVSIKTGLTAASLSFIGQVTKHTTVKWTIETLIYLAL